MQDKYYVTESFGGGVICQVCAEDSRPVRLNIETCIDQNAGWFKLRSVMFQKTTVFAIREYAIDQKFRLCSRSHVSAVASTIVSSIGGGGVSDASLLPLISRIEDLEDGQEPFVLGINENGDLEQTGMTSGNFDVDENGVLNFEDN